MDKRVQAPEVAALPLDRIWRRALRKRLRARLGPLQLVVTDNVHTMISFTRRRGEWRIRLHHMFLAADDAVVAALAAYLRGDDPQASQVLDRFIEKRRWLIRKVPLEVRQERARLDGRGEVHDLEAIFRALNRRHFRGRVDARITYGPAPRVRRPRKSIKLGSYSADARVIRIHPALDQRFVPRYFVSWIVFHEMLHHRLGATARNGRNGRRLLHTDEFNRLELRYPRLARARAWEDRHLDRLLRYSA